MAIPRSVLNVAIPGSVLNVAADRIRGTTGKICIRFFQFSSDIQKLLNLQVTNQQLFLLNIKPKTGLQASSSLSAN